GKTYFPSPVLSGFGNWIKGVYADDAIRKVVTDLHEETGETAFISTQNDCFMQIVDLFVASENLSYLDRGTQASVVCSSVGRAVLLDKTHRDVDKILLRSRRLGLHS